jgi:hypothetical protein
MVVSSGYLVVPRWLCAFEVGATVGFVRICHVSASCGIVMTVYPGWRFLVAGALPPAAVARLDGLYKTDFGRV